MLPSETESKSTVCLVEDDDFYRARLERWFETAPDFAVIGSYSDGRSALAEIPRKHPDVVILDLGLPNIQGGDCLRWLKANAPGIRILVLTGVPTNAVVFDALEAGADGFLDKEDYATTSGNFFAELREVCAGNNPLSARARRLLLDRYRNFLNAPPPMRVLTDRETEIAELWARGLVDKQIAERLSISLETVKTHAKHIFRKLDSHNRVEACYKLWCRK